MTCRLHRVVASLLIVVAGIQAAEQFTLRHERGTLNATIADELQIEEAGKSRDTKAIAVVGGRVNVQAAARSLLAQGKVARADPVVYLDGRIGDPKARAVATRQVLLEAKPGSDIGTLAREHGLRLVEAIKGRDGWWLAEPLSSDVYAALDAARSLAADPRTALAWPELRMPAELKYTPGDPLLQDLMVWHFNPARAGHMRIQNVWDYYHGEGTNIAITDGGIQVDHLDLEDNYRSLFSRDYINGDADPRPFPATSNDDNHGTAVAGLAVAVGDNATVLSAPAGAIDGGTAGVAYKAGLVASKVLNSYDASKMSGLPTDGLVRQALNAQMNATLSSEMVWVNNNSWGPIDDAQTLGVLQPLTFMGMYEATVNGRAGYGTVLVFPAGNGGWNNINGIRPNPPFLYDRRQDCSSFDGYLNRFTIGVGAYDNLLDKYQLGELGANLIISAPGVGVCTTDRTVRTRTNPNPANDDKGYVIWPVPPLSADFDGNDLPPLVWPADPDLLTYENGDYVQGVTGTSFACPLVSGAADLMLQARPSLSWRDVRQLLVHRGQDLLPNAGGALLGTPHFPAPGWGWDKWNPNAANLNYNCWYGFGGLDASRCVFGGAGLNTATDVASTAARDEPGALRWPLLPPLMPAPLNYSATFPIPATAPDPYAIYDAPEYPPSQTLVPDGRPVVGIGSRFCSVTMPITTAPARFRVETVELTVNLRDVGDSTYTYLPYGIGGGFRWSDYAFYLVSPSGTRAILGRQRNESSTTANAIPEGGLFTWTFTEFFHLNESVANGNWTLQIIDESNNHAPDAARDPANGNPPQCRVEAVNLNIYGHQTYDFPSLAGTSATGIASSEGDQTFDVSGSAFARSHAGASVLQAYWQPLAPTPGPAVEIGTFVRSDTRATVTVPTSLLPATSPGTGYVFLANPAVVVGRTGTGAGAVDAFDNPNATLPTTVSLPASVPLATAATTTASTRPMKRCPGTDDKIIGYSRRPTLTPLPDISLPTGGAFNVSTVAFDADVAAGLPLASPENLTVTVTSFNPYFIPAGNITVISPGAPGNGTYTISGTTLGSSSGFALIEVKATDGVLTTTRAFRVIIPSDEDPNSCGGGMGLALIGIPLAAWFIRRRRKDA